MVDRVDTFAIEENNALPLTLIMLASTPTREQRDIQRSRGSVVLRQRAVPSAGRFGPLDRRPKPADEIGDPVGSPECERDEALELRLRESVEIAEAERD
jgi:hypothetical protein